MLAQLMAVGPHGAHGVNAAEPEENLRRGEGHVQIPCPNMAEAIVLAILRKLSHA